MILKIILDTIKSSRISTCLCAQLLHFSIEDMKNDCPVGHLGQNRAFPVIYNILYDLCEPLKILQTMDNVTIIKLSSTWFVLNHLFLKFHCDLILIMNISINLTISFMEHINYLVSTYLFQLLKIMCQDLIFQCATIWCLILL